MRNGKYYRYYYYSINFILCITFRNSFETRTTLFRIYLLIYRLTRDERSLCIYLTNYNLRNCVQILQETSHETAVSRGRNFEVNTIIQLRIYENGIYLIILFD